MPKPHLENWISAAVPKTWTLTLWALDGSSPGFWPARTNMARYDALLGWSLGGQWAVRMAAEYRLPVVTLASGPRFAVTLERQAWLKAFQQQFGQDPPRTLRRFGMMMCQGGDHDRAAIRAVQNGLTEALDARIEALSMGLQALASWDLGRAWEATTGHRLSLTFDQDVVFPLYEADAVTEQMPGGHWPDRHQCQRIRERLEAWYHD